ncbi:unnamed protein product [Thlaspi arvense]|uniref:FKB95-like N-terminal Kelch domain-containing protein n=1 Tax=Thlaspi arvense TaxID=13288 RepID=A0AAU9SS25_THLAR|nr:unnamed protein product [Thlaspi arvense]
MPRLVTIRSLLLMDPYGLYVAVGSKLYEVNGSVYDYGTLCIDCRSHTVQPIFGTPKRMEDNKVAEIIDDKIYVINSEGDMWDHAMKKPDVELRNLWINNYVVMEDKIYMRTRYNSFVYEAKENRWESDEMLNSKK